MLEQIKTNVIVALVVAIAAFAFGVHTGAHQLATNHTTQTVASK